MLLLRGAAQSRRALTAPPFLCLQERRSEMGQKVWPQLGESWGRNWEPPEGHQRWLGGKTTYQGGRSFTFSELQTRGEFLERGQLGSASYRVFSLRLREKRECFHDARLVPLIMLAKLGPARISLKQIASCSSRIYGPR